MPLGETPNGPEILNSKTLTGPNKRMELYSFIAGSFGLEDPEIDAIFGGNHFNFNKVTLVRLVSDESAGTVWIEIDYDDGNSYNIQKDTDGSPYLVQTVRAS